jgi:putative ATPase
MALAPKSNALYAAYEAARRDAAKELSEPVPLHLRNAVTGLMKDVGYGAGYQYAHDFDDKLTAMTCLPDSMAGKRYYVPAGQGEEKDFVQRLAEIVEHR